MKKEIITLRIKMLALVILGAISLASCSSEGGKKHIVIVSTNDMHAAFENMPKLVTLVDSLRAEFDNVLVLDAGDRCTGNPYVDKAEPQGEPMFDLMNMVDYDYAVVGNHEFDYKQQGLRSSIDMLEAVWLCANADFSNAEVPIKELVKPYEIFEIGGVRTAILGLIQINDMGIPSAMPSNMVGIEFSNGVELSLDYRALKDSAELIIALSHLGFEDDSVLVCTNDMFDLVVGGHSHTHLPNGREINGTLVTQTGSKLRGVGITHIIVENGEVTSVTNEVVSLDNITPNPEAAEYVERCKDGSPLNNQIGAVDRDLTKVGLINMSTDIIRARSGADIVLQNGGSIRIDELPKGAVTSANIFKLEPFGNHIVTQKITVDVVKEMIMNKFNGGGSEARAIDLSPSGMTYEIIVDDKNEAVDVVCRDLKGRTMKGSSYVTMATSNYVNSAYIYSEQGTATAIEDQVVIADAIIEALKSVDTFVGDNTARVSIKKR